MPGFIISYLGGDQPSSPEEGKEHMARYMEWLASLGDAAISPANPFKDTRTVLPDGSVREGSTTAMSGFTLVEAESIDEALAMAKSCPFLEVNGSLEVSQVMQMSMPKDQPS